MRGAPLRRLTAMERTRRRLPAAASSWTMPPRPRAARRWPAPCCSCEGGQRRRRDGWRRVRAGMWPGGAARRRQVQVLAEPRPTPGHGGAGCGLAPPNCRPRSTAPRPPRRCARLATSGRSCCCRRHACRTARAPAPQPGAPRAPAPCGPPTRCAARRLGGKASLPRPARARPAPASHAPVAGAARRAPYAASPAGTPHAAAPYVPAVLSGGRRRRGELGATCCARSPRAVQHATVPRQCLPPANQHPRHVCQRRRAWGAAARRRGGLLQSCLEEAHARA
jgi:hypothetical protein